MKEIKPRQEKPQLTATAQALANVLGHPAIIPPASYSEFSKSRLSSLNYYPALFLGPKFDDPYPAYDDFDSAAMNQIDTANVTFNDLKNPVDAARDDLQNFEDDFSYDNTEYMSLDDSSKASINDSWTKAEASAHQEPQSFVKSEIKRIDAHEKFKQYKETFQDVRAAVQASKAVPASPKSVRDIDRDDTQKHDKDDGGGFKPS